MLWIAQERGCGEHQHARKGHADHLRLPKPFQGHIGRIQRNAIQSWRRLAADGQIILCGDEPGIAQVAAEFGVDHIPGIETNEFGTPLVSSAFRQAQNAARHDVVCYTNADLIFFPDLIQAVSAFIFPTRGVSCWSEELGTSMSMKNLRRSTNGREADIRRRVSAEGIMRGHDWIDFFVFRRHSIGPLPPFAVGRPNWDNWMIWRARKLRFAVVTSPRQRW